MRREPSSSRLKTNSSIPGSIYSRHLGAPVASIPGEEVAGRRRRRPTGRSRHRNCHSCSCCRSSQNHWNCRCCNWGRYNLGRCNCRRYSWRNHGSRGENHANYDCGNRDWNSCGNRYSKNLAAVDNLNSGPVDNSNWRPADRRSRAARQRGQG